MAPNPTVEEEGQGQGEAQRGPQVTDCPFCGIVAGTRAASRVYEDDFVMAFRDRRPIAPVHVLVVPRQHVESLAETDDERLLGRLLVAGARIARAEGLTGFKTVINTGREAGQTVFHLHVHIIGGRRFGEH